jgi:hypothetical protein
LRDVQQLDAISSSGGYKQIYGLHIITTSVSSTSTTTAAAASTGPLHHHSKSASSRGRIGPARICSSGLRLVDFKRVVDKSTGGPQARARRRVYSTGHRHRQRPLTLSRVWCAATSNRKGVLPEGVCGMGHHAPDTRSDEPGGRGDVQHVRSVRVSAQRAQ